MAYRSPDVQVFTCLGGNYVTTKALTSNVATLTTLTPHGYTTGDKVWITNVDSTFNSPYSGPTTITGTPTTTTFTYAVTAADVASTPVLTYGNVFKTQYWTKPSGATLVTVTMVGPGGGGGSGARQATTVNRTGGGAGGGGSWAEVNWVASQVPSTAMSVIVPNGGYGGLAITTDSTVGMAGQQGGTSTTFRDTDYGDSKGVSCYATNATGGSGGAVAVSVSAGAPPRGALVVGGTGGSGYNTTGGSYSGEVLAASGGGGGAGAAANVTTAAAGGGVARLYGVRALSGANSVAGNGTTTMDASLVAGSYAIAGMPAIGGAGGAYKTATAGGRGGDGVDYGGGGGGGGASDNGYASGAGGRGGDGCIVVITYF